MLYKKCLPFLALLFSSCLFAQLTESDVRMTRIETTPGKIALRTAVSLTKAGQGGQFLQISLTNDTAGEVSLNRMVVELPWARPAGSDALLCTGGWDMGRSEARVWPTDTQQKLETGSYVLSCAEARSTFAGFITWRTFNSKLRWDKGTLVISADGEGRLIKPGETVRLEKIWLTQGGNWQDLLFTYADMIAVENNIRLNRPKPYIGWATWDYYGRNWSFDQVVANMNKLVEHCPQADFVQLDGGWWPSRGDYMLVRENLGPDGMKKLAQLIRSKKLTAGIHLDGMRGDAKAIITREQPDYFLKNANGEILVSKAVKVGENLDYTFFDYSNPKACDYIKRVMANARYNWGYDYFKIDFLRFGSNEFISGVFKGREVIVPHDRSLTSVERIHRGLAAMREGMGGDAYLLACSSVFGPTFGHVDGVRSGADISPNFRQFKKCAIDNSGNFYLHGKVAYTDADYHVVRAAEDQDDTLVLAPSKDGGNLSLNEAWMWTHYIALCGGPRLNSDNLLTLREERRALFQFAASFPTAERYLPLDFWAHARTDEDPPSVILSETQGNAYLGIFNWSDAERNIVIKGIGKKMLAKISTVSGITAVTDGGNTLTIRLPARHSSILKLPEGKFDPLRHAITVE